MSTEIDPYALSVRLCACENLKSLLSLVRIFYSPYCCD